jgi:hypothetical protein
LRLSSTAATPSNLSARLNRKVSASWAMIVDDYYYEANRRMKHYKQESRSVNKLRKSDCRPKRACGPLSGLALLL